MRKAGKFQRLMRLTLRNEEPNYVGTDTCINNLFKTIPIHILLLKFAPSIKSGFNTKKIPAAIYIRRSRNTGNRYVQNTQQRPTSRRRYQ